jgi:hypothetical protein
MKLQARREQADHREPMQSIPRLIFGMDTPCPNGDDLRIVTE